MTRHLLVLCMVAAALVPGSARAAQTGAHLALSCALGADAFCHRLLAGNQAAGHPVELLPEGHEANPAQTASIRVAQGPTATPIESVPPEALLPPPMPPVPPPGLRISGAPPEPHSDLGLDVGAYFATAGIQLAMNLAVLASAGAFLALPSRTGGYLSEGDLNAVFAVAAVLAPPAMALPSSHFAYRFSARCDQRRPSFSKGFLAGGLSSMVVVWSAALFAMTFERENQSSLAQETRYIFGPALILAAGSLLIPAAEVLTLRFTSVHVTAAPIALKSGGGLALALAF